MTDRRSGKGIFGGGLPLSERAAAERWSLSARERRMVEELSK